MEVSRNVGYSKSFTSAYAKVNGKWINLKRTANTEVPTSIIKDELTNKGGIGLIVANAMDGKTLAPISGLKVIMTDLEAIMMQRKQNSTTLGIINPPTESKDYLQMLLGGRYRFHSKTDLIPQKENEVVNALA